MSGFRTEWGVSSTESLKPERAANRGLCGQNELMADIKTRDAVKGTIKTIDKAAVAGQRMKQAYISTKDKAEHSTSAAENSADEYAADRFERGVDTAVHEGAHQFDKAGRKGVESTKENIHKAKDGMLIYQVIWKKQKIRKNMNIGWMRGYTPND